MAVTVLMVRETQRAPGTAFLERRKASPLCMSRRAAACAGTRRSAPPSQHPPGPYSTSQHSLLELHTLPLARHLSLSLSPPPLPRALPPPSILPSLPSLFGAQVAEKPSIASSIATILSGHRARTRRSSLDVHEFEGSFQGSPAHFRVTSVIGHVLRCAPPPSQLGPPLQSGHRGGAGCVQWGHQQCSDAGDQI